jgi:hypothetical protein
MSITPAKKEYRSTRLKKQGRGFIRVPVLQDYLRLFNQRQRAILISQDVLKNELPD